MSATMFIPRNIHMSEVKYMIASITGPIVEIPGKSTQLFQNKKQVTINEVEPFYRTKAQSNLTWSKTLQDLCIRQCDRVGNT